MDTIDHYGTPEHMRQIAPLGGATTTALRAAASRRNGARPCAPGKGRGRPFHAVYTHKAVGYSYPTSPNADRLGFPKGCYTLSLSGARSRQGDPMPDKAVSGYATEAEAVAAARLHPLPWLPSIIRYHPDWIAA